MSQTKSSPLNSQSETSQSTQQTQPNRREPRQVDTTPAPRDKQMREADLDDITSLIAGEAPSSESRGKRSPRDEQPGRGEPDKSPLDEKPRPGLEMDDDEDDAAPQRKAKGKTVKEFSEEMELDADQLYSLLVPSDDPDDEPKTIGQLKDAYREIKEHQIKADMFEDAKAEAMNQVFTARQQIDSMLGRMHAVLGGEKMAEIFDDVSRDFAAQVQTAKQQVREFFPEWHNQQVYERDRKEFHELMGTYGFKPQEVDSVIDARLIKFGIDAMRLMGRYKRLKENFTREQHVSKEPPSTRRIRPNASNEASRLAQSGDTIGAVDALIQGTRNVNGKSR